jgi:hypothetical protein
MRKQKLLAASIALLFFCASCGGDDGDDEANLAAIDTGQALALNGNNAPAVSGLVVDTMTGGYTAGSLGNVVLSSSAAPAGPALRVDILQIAREALDRIPAVCRHGDRTTSGISAAQVPPSVSCSGGGTVTTDWRDADSNGVLSKGDGGLLSFDNCVEEDLTLNNGITVGVMEVIGDPAADPPWTVVLRLNFENLTASGGGEVVLVLGTLDATVEAPEPGTIVTKATTEVATGSDTTASSFLYFGEGEDFTELMLYSVSVEEKADGSFTLSSRGTLESSLIGGTVTFETLQDIKGLASGLDNPSAGEVQIVGAANSNILLRILDNVSLDLFVDDEGDGFDAADIALKSRWEELIDAADAL